MIDSSVYKEKKITNSQRVAFLKKRLEELIDNGEKEFAFFGSILLDEETSRLYETLFRERELSTIVSWLNSFHWQVGKKAPHSSEYVIVPLRTGFVDY